MKWWNLPARLFDGSRRASRPAGEALVASRGALGGLVAGVADRARRAAGSVGRARRPARRSAGGIGLVDKRTVKRVGPFGAAAQFLVIALGGGLATAWYAIEWGAAPTALSFGPWRTWINAGRADIDPYTRAHLTRRQRLAFDATIATTFEAQTDDTGEELHSACEYVITAPPIDASWWRLAVFTRDGRLLENRAGRHVLDRHTALVEPDGAIRVTLAREARAGNWLPTSGGGALTVLLTISEDRATASNAPQALPGIRRLACR
jgi:hypothetical protein